MAKYRVEESSDLELWDQFVELSPEGTVFNKQHFIQSVDGFCRVFFVYKGQEIVAGICVAINSDGNPIDVPYGQYQNGILFKSFIGVTHNKRITEQFKLSELIINEISSVFKTHSIVHSTDYTDLRSFQWHNYHTPKLGTYDIQLLYTASLSVENKSDSEIISNIRTLRRRDLNKVENFSISKSLDVEMLNSMHDDTFTRQGLVRSNLEKEFLKKVAKGAIDHGFGEISVCEIEGESASANLFLFDSKRSYYLIGANNPNYRNTGASTKLMMSNIFSTRDNGMKYVDFVGANSPQRGDFKVSFNAEVLPYFKCTLRE